MKDEYRKEYCKQLDRITLSDSADRAILNDIKRVEGGEKMDDRRSGKNVRAAAIAAVVILACSATVVGAAVHGLIVRSERTGYSMRGIETTRVSMGECIHLDLLAGDSGEIYTITDTESSDELAEYRVDVWRTDDRGETWQAVLSRPEELQGRIELVAGDLRQGISGIEAAVVYAAYDSDAGGEAEYRVFRMTGEFCTEYSMDEVCGQIGNLSQIRYVNDHTFALLSSKACLLYDADTQEVVKELPYDLTMGCLLTQNQFLFYGEEIYVCLNADTLEEEDPEAGLEDFVRAMFGENENDVFPPMQAEGDTVVCVTKNGIYEFCAGETIQTRVFSGSDDQRVFNGLLPICKGQHGEYYIYTPTYPGISLLVIDGDDQASVSDD